MTTQTTTHVAPASVEESDLATQVLTITNCHASGALSAEAAIDVFKRSGLPYTSLRDIWAIADKNGNGKLAVDELILAIRLMGWVQAGEPLEESLLEKSGPLPTLDGITDTAKLRNTTVPSVIPVQLPPVKPEDIARYTNTFLSAGSVNGFLDGDKAMETFVTHSTLPYTDIWKINKLVQRTERESLDFREFSLGLHIIYAVQSCEIPSIPSTFPEAIYGQIPEHSQVHNSPSKNQGPAPHEASTSRRQLMPVASTSSVSSSSGEKAWIISPQEKDEADQLFAKADIDCQGFIAGDAAANFFLKFGLPPDDLTKIWKLSDLNDDNRMTINGFAVALHLIHRRLNGEDIPTVLPLSLASSSRYDPPKSPMVLSPRSPSISLRNKGPPPPPPPKRNRPMAMKGLDEVTSPSDTLSPLPPIPPKITRPSRITHSKSLSTLAFRPATSPSTQSLLSPFEDPIMRSSAFSNLSAQNTPPVSPRPDTNVEALEEFKRETARLTHQVESLLGQLTAQNRLRDSNEALRSENDNLKNQLRELERTVSEVLSASDLHQSQEHENEQYIQTIDRLTAELATKDAHTVNLERMLAVVSQDVQELRDSLQESQQVTNSAKGEVEELKKTINSQDAEITQLKERLEDLDKAMAEPSSENSPRELRVVIRSVTKENEKLKSNIRDMQKSMEKMLMSAKYHGKHQDLERENERLKQHVEDIQLIATKLQSQQNSTLSSQDIENIQGENANLKARLREGQRAFAQQRSMSETKIFELRQRIDILTHENNRLKVDVQSATDSSHRGPREDNSVPPPSYDDSFVIP